MKLWCVIIMDVEVHDASLIIEKTEQEAMAAVIADRLPEPDEKVEDLKSVLAHFDGLKTLAEVCAKAGELSNGAIEYFPEEREV